MNTCTTPVIARFQFLICAILLFAAIVGATPNPAPQADASTDAGDALNTTLAAIMSLLGTVLGELTGNVTLTGWVSRERLTRRWH